MTKVKFNRLLIITTVSLGVLWSCQSDKGSITQTDGFALISEQDAQEMTQLGEQLENPYSVENMRRAWESIKTKNANDAINGEQITITTTHLYLRFKPKTEEELAILTRDPTLILYTYPLDHEITEPGDFYRDPEIPLDQPTYQYTAVPVDKALPKEVEYEVLAELFIPDEDSDDAKEKVASDELVELLVEEALLITGNIEKEKVVMRRRKWRPAGRIRVWDDHLQGYVGLEGVEVRARRWFTTHKGIADAQGNYSCDGRFRRDANYKIKWERHQYSIRKGALGQAKLDGPKKRGDWNVDIKDGRQEYYATIFRASHHYYYKDIKGLRRPPQNTFWRPQMKIGARYEENGNIGGDHGQWRRVLGILNWINIWDPDRLTQQIYATTIHELAHASHWGMGARDFNDTSIKVKESWARGVQWDLTRMVWSNYRGGYTTSIYTQVVVDMIDPNYLSDNEFHNLNEGLWNDNVTGYTIRQIEDALNEHESWNEWKNSIKNRYDNATEQYLDALFHYWDTFR